MKKLQTCQPMRHTLITPIAALFACASAHASVAIYNESNGTGTWTLPSGTNLLTGRAPGTTPATHESSDSTWNTVVDGTLGDTGGGAATSVTPNNNDSVTFALDLTGHAGGYNITSFDSYCTWGNTGRDNQDYNLQYSTVSAPTTFINITGVNNRTGSDRSTHTRITDTSGFLATNVHSIRIVFARDQENGYVGFREFVLQDAPTVVNINNEANDLNTFFVPTGTNLLAGRTPNEASPAVHEASSSTWAVVTDGSVGDYTSPASSVTPNNNDTLTYPLDLTSHPSGYSIASFDSFCAWGSNGRDDQNYTLSYSTVGAPTTFTSITSVVNHTEFNGPNNRRATHSRITSNTGTLATGVHSVRITFANNQENGYTGFREFVLKETPINTVVNESNSTNSWTLPAGTNLLATATANPSSVNVSNHGNGDITNASWTILTDGSVGAAGTQTHAAAPTDNQSVVFSLDLSSNTKGYNITSFDSYCAWPDTGRDNQDFTILYSTVNDPTTFLPIETISNHTNSPLNSTHTRVTAPSGFLATNVGAIKFFFNNQENGYVGYREFIVQGTAVPLSSPLTWAGLSGSGGNATWNPTSTPDNNWKDGGVTSTYSSTAPLTFDNTGTNTNITVASGIVAASMSFSNTSLPYTFGGSNPLIVTNGLTLSGSGNATFNNALQTSAVTVSGTGALTLAAANTLTGSTTISNGVLNLTNDTALGSSSLTVTGGSVNFKSASPVLSSLSGTAGTVFLGDAGTSGDTGLLLGDTISTTYAGAITDASASANGSLLKVGSGTLTLSGPNTYTGQTYVFEGELALAKRLSLYGGVTSMWTDTNVIVQAATVSLRVGGTGEFTSSDVAALNTAGFDFASTLALDTSSGDAEISNNLGGNIKIRKDGPNTLRLSGTNTYTQGITVTRGVLEAANPSGYSISSDLTVGNATFNALANMANDNQFAPGVALNFNTGSGAPDSRVNFRGHSQTIAGLESGTGNRLVIVQNDETTMPGYAGNPGPMTLTINATTDHSYHGILRNQDGGAVSVVKNGPGTQELINNQIQGYSYSGPTTINDGTFRLRFGGGQTGFGSNITVNPPGMLEMTAVTNFQFDRLIAGAGHARITGAGYVIPTNGSNSLSGGTTVDGGHLALIPLTPTGDGTAPGQTCVGGAMDPANLIDLINGGVLWLDNTAPLGNSNVVPQFAPSIHVNEGSQIIGGGASTSSIAFVSNITLNGGLINVCNGTTTGGFNTNLALVGTVIVGGSSTMPSTISTSGSGPNANATLGSVGAPGTTFQVADVTGDGTADLNVSSILRDVLSITSPLIKTGPGTMVLSGANTYTGDTTVSGGTLGVSGNSIADTNKLVINGGKVDVAPSANETVNTLFFGGIQQVAGTYGSTSSSATYKDDSRFSGTGIVTVLTGAVADAYAAWASVITDPDQRDKTDDPDGDGFTNLQEYLLGTSPIANNGALSTVEKNGGGLIIRWCERAQGTYLLEQSATLQSWVTSSVVPTTSADQTGLYSADYTRKEALIPIDDPKKFARIHATTNP